MMILMGHNGGILSIVTNDGRTSNNRLLMIVKVGISEVLTSHQRQQKFLFIVSVYVKIVEDDFGVS